LTTPFIRAASSTLTTDWWLADASALMISAASVLRSPAKAALRSCKVRPSILAPLTAYVPCELTTTTQDGVASVEPWALAEGKLTFIWLKRDQVVVSIKKMRTTKSTSMKGIKLMSGSMAVLFLNFKMNSFEV